MIISTIATHINTALFQVLLCHLSPSLMRIHLLYILMLPSPDNPLLWGGVAHTPYPRGTQEMEESLVSGETLPASQFTSLWDRQSGDTRDTAPQSHCHQTAGLFQWMSATWDWAKGLLSASRLWDETEA